MSAKLTKKMWKVLQELEEAAEKWCRKCDYKRCDGCAKITTLNNLVLQMNKER